MFEIIGKYNKAKIYASTLEDSAYKQILNMLNQKFVENSNISIMPDCHSGSGCVIGFTQTIENKVVPNLVGCDVGCGMLVTKISKDIGKEFFNKNGLEKLDKIIHEKIPSGMKHRDIIHPFANNINLKDIITDVNVNKLLLSIGTLGGGNHFIEVDIDEEENYYIVIHSGSRHLGIEVCNYWQNKAIKHCSNNNELRNKIIEQCKKEHREKDIEKELSQITYEKIPKELSYLEDEDLREYLHDMGIAQEFAKLNRETMMDIIIKEMGIKKKYIIDEFCTIHNYIDLKNMIIRKGSISAQKDEISIIPMNMRDGSLIVKGKGNKDWNYSLPHGAGRLMSRSQAKETLNMKEFKDNMKDVFTTCVNSSTIDESPMAYKPMDEIIKNIQENAEIINIIKPIYNFKASE